MQVNSILYSAMLKFIVEQNPLSAEDNRIVDDCLYLGTNMSVEELTAALVLVKHGIEPNIPESIKSANEELEVISASLLGGAYIVIDKNGHYRLISGKDAE